MAWLGNSAGRVAFTHPDFVLFSLARFLIIVSLEMQSVAVGWQVYEITHRPLDLGLVGLAQFLPGVLLFLPSGHATDRFNRKRVLNVCYSGFALCSLLLLSLTLRGPRSVFPIYLVLVMLGIVRSFNWPSSRAILPQLVPAEHFPNAVSWNSTVLQGAVVLGPSLGGVVYAFFRGPAAVYGSAVAAAAVALFCTFRLRPRAQERPRETAGWSNVLAGFRYIWRNKIILGSISLDLFAVLLGGAVALLPIFASEILKTGPWGLGLLRSAPGVGALLTGIVVSHWHMRRNLGVIMLWCVAGFGVATIVFGLSRNLWLSLVALFLVGATDMVSVIIRATLVQVATPDQMRGRVNAVDMLFIGASNELGEFESGLTAHWFGTVPAVVLGGVGTLVVIAIWAWLFPEFRSSDPLGTVEEPA